MKNKVNPKKALPLSPKEKELLLELLKFELAKYEIQFDKSRKKPREYATLRAILQNVQKVQLA